LFPELKFAGRWKQTGRRVLEAQARELIYDDGSFSQHSANYHRLMLHDYLWALRLGELLTQPFTDELKGRITKAAEFLYQIQDEASGRVPCFGHNDGTLVLPLSNCDYQDFRPVIQASLYLGTKTRCYSTGPWDEELLWLFGQDAMAAPIAEKNREELRAEQGGCYTLRSQDSFVFARCGSFRHRPSQSDMLHTDVWWRGQNIALDAGTFSYNAPAPWDDQLSRTIYHNTVTVDGLDQMERVRRFLWLPWASGRVCSNERSAGGHLGYWEGEHDGYARLNIPAVHRRAILRINDHWVVLDRMTSAAEHEYRLHWLLMDAPYEWDEREKRLRLETPAGSYYVELGSSPGENACSRVRGDESSPRGWHSPYYNHREPVLSVSLAARGSSLYFWTLFGSRACEVRSSRDTFELMADRWQAKVNLRMHNAGGSMAASVTLGGLVRDQLDIV
jgi:asparagine synthase (glutamine-hydrolysing)